MIVRSLRSKTFILFLDGLKQSTGNVVADKTLIITACYPHTSFLKETQAATSIISCSWSGTAAGQEPPSGQLENKASLHMSRENSGSKE